MLDIFLRGWKFIRSNPQILHTLFLAIIIPVAFVYTSNQFFGIALENQNRLEYSRNSYLQDGFILFAAEHIYEPEVLDRAIQRLASENETMSNFRVLGKRIPPDGPNQPATYPVISSLRGEEVGSAIALDPRIEPSIASAMNDSHHSYSAELYAASGRYWESIRAIPATSTGETVGFIVTDISVAKADAVSLRNMRNAYLVLLVIIIAILTLLARQARILDYASLYQRLKEVDSMKDDFVSMAAHELRSPLTVIRGYVDLISDYEGIAEEHRKLLKRIDESAQQLNVLVGDILDVAKLQEGRMAFNYKTIDASEVIAGVTESFVHPAEEKGLKLFYDKLPLPSVSVDPDRFRQVMINLVGNAVKYTPKGEVRVVAYAEKERVFIRVSDTGMGMTADEQRQLFQKFYRVKNKDTEKITGTGLGLWITERIVKTMKGTLTVESIKWKGTDFILSFPVAAAEKQ
jgi:signal transduction histidine kinase